MKIKTAAVAILCAALLLGSGCKKNPSPSSKPSGDSGLFFNQSAVLKTEGLAHEPYGRDQLYGAKEAPEIWWERSPRDPQAGDTVEISVSLWRTDADSVWLDWALNGEQQETVLCRQSAVLQDEGLSKRKYVGTLGPFEQGDRVEYMVRAGNEDKPEGGKAALGPYTFSVLQWEAVEGVESVTQQGAEARLSLKTSSLRPEVTLSSSREGTLRLTVEPDGESRGGQDSSAMQETAKLSLGGLSIAVGTQPYSFTLSDKAGKVLVRDTGKGDGLQILTDGETVRGIRLNLQAPEEQGFYGFGMKYDSLNQRNKDVDIYCVNWYTDQAGETYTPVPYYFVPNTYGLYVDSTYYSRFAIDTERKNVCTVETAVRDTGAAFYLFCGDNAAIAEGYACAAGKAVLPPVWAFGPWISANEWNRQSEVMEQLEQTTAHDIPTSVIVLEAWSDEETFYTWNDSQFEAADGGFVPELEDFTFGGRWPDPKGMVDALHDEGIRVLLWQIPVLKFSGNAAPQSKLDQRYALEQGYVLKNGDGSPYRLPSGTWFGNSLLVDFTNPQATDWFLSKRRYLLEDIGVDGFKTDGGEFIWGRDVTAFDGRRGDELRNAYPDLYAQAYFDYSRMLVPDAVTFSRAGGASMQTHPLCWVGDQRSTQRAFEEALRAALSASMSGIPFVAWDIAGFSGDVPTAELYQRAVAQAAFSPVMQVHSETSGDPNPSQARTPWNMAERKGDSACLDTYRFFANVRMNLLPYLYTEARHSSRTGEPLMRSMAYAFPGDETAAEYEFQYMFGGSLLVAPAVEMGEETLDVYFPEGTWYGLFDGKAYTAGIHTVDCPLGALPVFVKSGSILPLNLGESGKLGGSVGNATDSYQNLTFWAYPGGGEYSWYDYVNGKEETVKVLADGKMQRANGTESADIVLQGNGWRNSGQAG